MTQHKGHKPRGWCVCKKGAVMDKHGNLYKHFPSKLKYTNRDGYCVGSGKPPVFILLHRRLSRSV